ncbi:30S ribosomal protein S2 [Mesohalobacter halotolerans]|uniref:Small ribosomal subunit protein uS2 n=1 Tax=Mesohalobacter halotolerans TaxID=1883405 RepID=A0A4U5TRW9_9FLAO|nr:30S ribosomal protein S2 [Mesohalobacter halotolerans]MBS3737958.1 30S ribosomal protein S2 [Psychroflexus sp.]TKS56058.1 30S ribosomal protein S2 [Mesohalobacter halotolerans]
MAKQTKVKELLDAGVHFGHLTRRWNPNMAPYIYMERNGIHIINLYKTAAKLDEATQALTKIAASGRKILFVATKKQAKEIVAEQATKAQQPYITERWPGGMLTNFVTIRKSVKKMAAVDRMKKDGSFDTLSKKEKLQINRMRAKLEKNLGSISDMTRLPGALFVVDIIKENIAVKEAQKLNIPVFAMVDTNSDPREVDYVIPANDDASKSINKVVSHVADSIVGGLEKRETQKKEDAAKKEAEKKAKEEAKLEKAKKAEEENKAEESKKAEEKKASAAKKDKKASAAKKDKKASAAKKDKKASEEKKAEDKKDSEDKKAAEDKKKETKSEPKKTAEKKSTDTKDKDEVKKDTSAKAKKKSTTKESKS